MEEKLYLALLHKIGFSQKKLFYVFEKNSEYKKFYENISIDILGDFGFSQKQKEYIIENKKKFTLKEISKTLEKRNVKIVTIKDNNYPEYLKEIPNKPYMFYLRGKIDNSPKFAIVGSRKISSYGQTVIDKIIGPISSYFTIISGGASGCDSLAHIKALEFGNKTISIIGTGIDLDYPTNNKKLYDEIVEKGGGIISIFPIGEYGNPYNFPIRNELVAGLSSGVLVIEAKKKSGSLITGNLALELGKDLFAIPGDINKINSEGCNQLIKNGMAKLVTGPEDILEEYNIYNSKKSNPKKSINFIDEIEKEIYETLIFESLTTDQLMQKIKLDISTINFKLSIMEINNIIKKSNGGKYEIF